MNTLDIAVLNGIDEEIQSSIYDAMKSCSNAQRLCVCLYFMSDLPDYEHSLERIEGNLSKIFPPSIPHGNTPKTYRDFAATAIRQYFNYETGAVRDEEIAVEDRLWHNPQRGHWRNTNSGNAYALHLLKERGITIRKQGDLQEPGPSYVDYSKRRYLDEQKAPERTELHQNQPAREFVGNSPESSNASDDELGQGGVGSSANENILLTKVFEVLSIISQEPLVSRINTDGEMLTLAGSPSLIHQLLLNQQSIGIEVLEFHLSRESDTWLVEIVCTA